jgi:nucleoside-diphosphate-sugar epimerase
MKNVLLIGATGLLGSYLAKTYKPTIATTRFEDPLQDWKQYKDIDTVWLVARACRKTAPRRDEHTRQLELQGIQNIIDTFKDCHVTFTSTKCVYGLTDNSVHEVFVNHIGNLMCHSIPGTSNVPHNEYTAIDLEPLGIEHRIYAETKLAAEEIVKTARSYTIMRIWDIIK